MDIVLFKKAFEVVDQTLASYVGDHVAAVASTIAPAIYSGMGIYVMFYGFLHIIGKVQEPVMEFMVKTLKMAIIVSLSVGLAEYNTLIVDNFNDSSAALASAFSMANQGDFGGVLDKTLSDFMTLAAKWFSDLGIVTALVALVIMLTGIILTAYAAYLVMLSKLCLGILFSIGPLYIASLLFDSTRKFFDSWISAIINHALVGVFVVAADTLIIHITRQLSGDTNSLPSTANFADFAPLLAMAVVSILVLGQVTGLAAGLSGGMSLATMGVGRMMGRVIFKGMSATTSPIKKQMEWRKAARDRIEVGRREERMRAKSADKLSTEARRNEQTRDRVLARMVDRQNNHVRAA